MTREQIAAEADKYLLDHPAGPNGLPVHDLCCHIARLQINECHSRLTVEIKRFFAKVAHERDRSAPGSDRVQSTGEVSKD